MRSGPRQAHVRDYWDSHVAGSGLDRGIIERLRGGVTALSSARDPIAVLAPFTLEPLGWVPNCLPEDIGEAVRRARAAQPAWAERSFAARREILLRFHDLLLAPRRHPEAVARSYPAAPLGSL